MFNALVRTMFSAVLGLGGWMVAVAVVRAADAGGAVDDRSLATAAIALPVAAGTYYGWRDRRRSRRSRRTALAAAVSAAIIGAWLGHAAAGALPALVTSLAGAVTAANLATIGYVRRICAPTSRSSA